MNEGKFKKMSSVKQDNQKLKLSPKLTALVNWEKIAYVNEMLDSGESPNSVCKWINKNGFKVSPPIVYDYNKIRQNAVLNGISIEKILGVSQTANIKQGSSFQGKKQKLKSEIDVLDKIIELGYSGLQSWTKPMPISMMMQAIKLKHDMTEGYFNGLTPYGLEQLTLLEKQKYDVIMEVIMQYVPEDTRDEVVQVIADTEEEFYKRSDYYEDYLRASGVSEPEIRKRMEEYEAEQEESNESTIEV